MKALLNSGLKSMGDKMVDANGVLGMIIFAAAMLEERDGRVWKR